jgi:hypothetical protein
LAGFPYVDYHPSFPYSVFLGPSGAQYNVPQVYWKDIGGGLGHVMAHAYRWNRPYGRPIYPLGQLYQHPNRGEILRFRQLARANGADGVSWWDWQEASSGAWRAVGDPIGTLQNRPSQAFQTLARGFRGDPVVWAQEHLLAAGQTPRVDGRFGSGTKRAVKSFQLAVGLPVTGKIDTHTWGALLRFSPTGSQTTTAGTHAASAGGRNGPPTAHLRSKRREIPPPAER